MSTQNYSIAGLNDLGNLSVFLMMDLDRYDPEVIRSLRQSQFDLIEQVQAYANIVKHSQDVS